MRSSHATNTVGDGKPSPSELFSEYILENAQVNGHNAATAGQSIPHGIKGLTTPESHTSLIAMIHGIFVGGGGKPTSQETNQDENLFLRHKNSKSCLSTTMMAISASESREEICSDAASGASRESRPRSRGIPIQRTPPSQTFSDNMMATESPDDACKETYDWATWRMYHRIIDHRAKYPVNANYMRTCYADTSGNSTIGSTGSNHRADTYGMPLDWRAQLLRSNTCMLEEDIFQMDM